MEVVATELKDLPNGTIFAKDGVDLLNKPAVEAAKPAEEKPIEVAKPAVEKSEDAPPADEYRTKYEALEKEVAPLREKATEADKYKAQLDADPYDGDTEIAALAKLKKQGIPTETALKYLGMDISTMSAKDKMVLSIQLAKPTIKREDIEFQVNKKYGLGEFASENEQGEKDESQGLKDIEFEVAGQDGIEAKLAQQKEDLLKVAAKPRSEVAKEQTELAIKNDWEKQLPTLKEKAKTFELTVKGLDKPIKIDLDLKDEDVNELVENWTKSGHAPTESNLKVAEKILHEAAIGRNTAKIVEKAIMAVTGKQEEVHYDELHNPSAKASKPQGELPKSGMDELKAAVEAHKNRNKN